MSKKEIVREAVRVRYAQMARGGTDCCCCEPLTSAATLIPDEKSMAKNMGYSKEEIESVPEGANLGLGCGNPVAIADLKSGETVVDLGSGSGFDCFLAARKVGPEGRVIGVDMTDEMLTKARENARKNGFTNVDFLKGLIEDFPVEDNMADVVISNCVINLSPDKSAVFKEAFRILKPGGRFEVSDIVATEELSDEIRKDLDLVGACIGGAATEAEITRLMKDAGFKDIRIFPKENGFELIKQWGSPWKTIPIISAYIRAIKP